MASVSYQIANLLEKVFDIFFEIYAEYPFVFYSEIKLMRMLTLDPVMILKFYITSLYCLKKYAIILISNDFLIFSTNNYIMLVQYYFFLNYNIISCHYILYMPKNVQIHEFIVSKKQRCFQLSLR